MIPDKVTSGTYYQALLQCKRRAGEKEEEFDKRRSYFKRRFEDYQEKLAGRASRLSASSASRKQEDVMSSDGECFE